MTIRVGNGAGFLGDQLDAPRRLAEAGDLDYLTLEYLAELTMSILARRREKDPAAGYADDFLDVLPGLTRNLNRDAPLKIVTNAGGINPECCAVAAGKILVDAGLGDEQIGVVTGDDLLPRLAELQAGGYELRNLDTGQPLSDLDSPVVSANAYLGAGPLVESIQQGARITIAGRVADASLTLAPAVAEFGWSWNDWPMLAAASVAGHLIECGAQATGGYSVAWQGRRLADVGYPIAEIGQSGDIVITKAPGTGGSVTRRSVVEQLVYEIGDPSSYLTPDVVVDFTTVQVQQDGQDRVRVAGASGRPAPEKLKVSLAYRDGFMASAMVLVYGDDCLEKARECEQIVWERLSRAGVTFSRKLGELLGAGQAAGASGAADAPFHGREIVLRLTVHDPRREAVERFTREIAPLITSGPAGLAGYAAGRAVVRPVFAYWPTLIPRELVVSNVRVQTARNWARG